MHDMWTISTMALGPIVAVVVSLLLIWAGVALQRDGNQLLNRILIGLGELFLIVGICAGIIINAHFMSVFMLVAAMIISVGAINRFYVAERQSLLWVLTIAAERGIPLESAARAFADERNDVIGRRATLLADYLEAGVPLALALARARCVLTPAAHLAATLGGQTGTLGISLRQATCGLEEDETTLRQVIEKLFYLIFLTLCASTIVTFIMLKITPVIAKMMEEFELQMPHVSQQLIGVADAIAGGWGFPLWLAATAVFVFAILCYVGLSPRQLPLVNRLWWAADCALVMRWLAIAVRQDLPLGEMVRMLASHFPQTRVRRRLERASNGIDRGQDWTDGLRRAGIFRRREQGLAKAAIRAGNLAWALDEMAESGIRKSAYRLRAWTNVIFPAILLGFGAIVLFICVGLLLPLIALIQGMA